MMQSGCEFRMAILCTGNTAWMTCTRMHMQCTYLKVSIIHVQSSGPIPLWMHVHVYIQKEKGITQSLSIINTG